MVTTGQGLLGNNMFAYCYNNPINYIDSLGRSPDWHPWDDAIEWLVEWLLGTDIYSKQDQIDFQITIEQNKHISKVTKNVGEFVEDWWDAYIDSIEIQVRTQYEQDMTVRKVVGVIKDNPEDALSYAKTTFGTYSGYLSFLGWAGLTVMPPGVSAFLTVVCFGLGIWDQIEETIKWEDNFK